MQYPTFKALIVVAVMLLCQSACGDTLVQNPDEFQKAIKAAGPGDTVVMANGVWRDIEMVFAGKGTTDRPITLRAETNGEVIISGRSNLRLHGEHLVVRGLVFRDGYSPTNTVIAFRRSAGQFANHTRVTEVVIDHFNNPERHETDFWVMMYGKNNRFDHNHLEGKSNSGVTMAVRLDSTESQENHHRIDHNYFGPRPVLGSNGGETLRIGTSKYSLTDSYTVVENNFFDRCNGEVEIISSKSGKNEFRGNVFYESRGTLTLRHGNGNLVEDNAFFGNGVDHTGGIRVINKRQVVRNNLMSGLTGSRFGGALVIMNGVPDSPINRYHQVEDSIIENNTIVNSDHVELAAGSDSERSAPPIRTTFRNNLIVNDKEQNSIAVHDDISGITFEDNVVDGVAELPSPNGFVRREVKLKEHDNGVPYPEAGELRGTGVSESLAVIDREATGPAWYPKPGYGSRFDSGNAIAILPGQDSLTEAVTSSKAGDIITLGPGEYLVSKFLVVSHPLTISGKAGAGTRPVIRFERSTLFEIASGGSLKLAHLDIDGSIAPDAYGNSAVRTSRYSMLDNYELVLNDVQVRNLNTNHSFNFLNVSKHTFADKIAISNSTFSNVSGHVLALDREIDDLGIYNAEYVTISNSRFSNIDGSLATIYRGGTDESTFGPHFLLENSSVVAVGAGKRNKSKSSVYLLGVQVVDLHGNTFDNSQAVTVLETVGEPRTRLSANKFNNTPTPSVGPLSGSSP